MVNKEKYYMYQVNTISACMIFDLQNECELGLGLMKPCYASGMYVKYFQNWTTGSGDI